MGEAQFGVPQVIGAPINNTRISEQAMSAIPPRLAKFTLEEWKLNNDQRLRNTLDQQQLADRVLAECERVRDETDDRTKTMKDTSDHRIEHRIDEVRFNMDELMNQRKEIYDELEALDMYKTRLYDCLGSLETNAITVIKKCLMLRDRRIGIDLVIDPVESAMQTEINIILGGQSLLKRAMEQLNEQMRRLRATRYMLDRDLQYKQNAIDIDENNLGLKPPGTCIYEGNASLDAAGISADEYNQYTANNIQAAAREVTSARPIRVYIDTLLKQVIDDLWNAYHTSNHELQMRIDETKNSKALLEELHYQTTEKIFKMQNNIVMLKKALVEKESNIGVAHTRLGRRAQRVGGELVKDAGSQALLYECEMLRYSVEQLQQMLMESNQSLRYLLQTQLQLEEDINVKMNTLKIDEVECMTLRATMDYHAY